MGRPETVTSVSAVVDTLPGAAESTGDGGPALISGGLPHGTVSGPLAGDLRLLLVKTERRDGQISVGSSAQSSMLSVRGTDWCSRPLVVFALGLAPRCVVVSLASTSKVVVPSQFDKGALSSSWSWSMLLLPLAILRGGLVSLRERSSSSADKFFIASRLRWSSNRRLFLSCGMLSSFSNSSPVFPALESRPRPSCFNLRPTCAEEKEASSGPSAWAMSFRQPRLPLNLGN